MNVRNVILRLTPEEYDRFTKWKKKGENMEEYALSLIQLLDDTVYNEQVVPDTAIQEPPKQEPKREMTIAEYNAHAEKKLAEYNAAKNKAIPDASKPLFTSLAEQEEKPKPKIGIVG